MALQSNQVANNTERTMSSNSLPNIDDEESECIPSERGQIVVPPAPNKRLEKKNKSNRFTVTDVTEQTLIQHTSPKSEEKKPIASSSSRRVGKTQRKGRFLITDLDPDSPDTKKVSAEVIMDEDRTSETSPKDIEVAVEVDVTTADPKVEISAPRSKLDGTVIDRLIDSVLDEQIKLQEAVDDVTANNVEVMNKLADSVVDPNPSPTEPKPARISPRVIPKQNTTCLKGKYESIYNTFAKMQKVIQLSRTKEIVLEKKNAMLQTRLNHEIRANEELRAQLDLLTQYTESLFHEYPPFYEAEMDSTFQLPGDFEPKPIVLSREASTSSSCSIVQSAGPDPPASFQPPPMRRQSSLNKSTASLGTTGSDSSQFMPPMTKQRPVSFDAVASDRKAIAPTPLDKMLFSQASDLAEKLHCDSPAVTPMHASRPEISLQPQPWGASTQTTPSLAAGTPMSAAPTLSKRFSDSIPQMANPSPQNVPMHPGILSAASIPSQQTFQYLSGTPQGSPDMMRSQPTIATVAYSMPVQSQHPVPPNVMSMPGHMVPPPVPVAPVPVSGQTTYHVRRPSGGNS